MADKRVEIQVGTTGDTSGLKDVSKELDNVAESAKKVTVETQQSFTQRFFPTFSKGIKLVESARESLDEMGKKVGGLTGMIMQGLANPWAAASGIVTTAALGIIQAFRDVQQAEKDVLEIAGESWKKQKLAVDSFLPSQSALVTSLNASATAVGQITERLTANESAIAKAIASETALAESAKALALARIQLAEAEGRLSQSDAARQRAMIEATTAEEAFTRQTDAANAVLQARRDALAQVTAEMEKLQTQRDAMMADAAAADTGSVRDKGAAIDPVLNANVDQARAEVQAALRDATVTWEEYVMGFVEAIKASPNLSFSVAGLGMAFKQGKDQIDARVEAAKEDEKKRTAELEAAIDARVQAIDRNAAASRDAINAVTQQLDAATVRLEEVKRQAAEAQAAADSLAPGGTANQIFQNKQAVGGVGTMVAGSTPITPADVADAADSTARREFLAAIADGIQQRELVFLDQLLAIISTENTGNNSLQQRLKRLEEQIAVLRTGL
jgi:hypothetical protein